MFEQLRTKVAPRIEVSTVQLPASYGHWYETMVFGGSHHGMCWRTSTAEDARAKHESVCAMERSRA